MLYYVLFTICIMVFFGFAFFSKTATSLCFDDNLRVQALKQVFALAAFALANAVRFDFVTQMMANVADAELQMWLVWLMNFAICVVTGVVLLFVFWIAAIFIGIFKDRQEILCQSNAEMSN